MTNTRLISTSILISAGALTLAGARSSASSATPSALQTAVVPVGTVMAYAGKAVPAGWLIADGQALRRADYPALFAAIDTAHGAGVRMDGAKEPGTDFNLPDYRGVFLRGVDRDRNGIASSRDARAGDRLAARGPGGFRGNMVGSFQDYATARPQRTAFTTGDESNKHSHPVVGGNKTNHVGNDADRGTDMGMNNSFSIGENDRGHTHTVSVGGDEETRPKNVAVYWIIKVR